MTTIRVVIPSLLGEVSRLESMCDAATRVGASPFVIANGAQLYRQLTSTSIPHLTSRCNDGFGASVTLGAGGDWDWLVILNDDLAFEADDLASCLSAAQLDTFDLATIVHFDNEPARPIPTRIGVLLSVSLLSNVARRTFPRRRPPQPEGTDSYHSFSAVAIGRLAWDRAGGFDPRFPFAYEDADFVRRARELGVHTTSVDTSIVHLHSQTSGRFITAVLPVVTWSALEYLTKWFGKRTLHRWLLLLALAVRAPLAAATAGRPRRELHAVANAARVLILDERPALPGWETV